MPRVLPVAPWLTEVFREQRATDHTAGEPPSRGKTEVAKHRASGSHFNKDRVRREILVHHALFVRMRQRTRHVAQQALDLLRFERATQGDRLPQGAQ